MPPDGRLLFRAFGLGVLLFSLLLRSTELAGGDGGGLGELNQASSFEPAQVIFGEPVGARRQAARY